MANVLVLGGSGRVGASTAVSLLPQLRSSSVLRVAGRDEARFRSAVQRWPMLDGCSFEQVDRNNPSQLSNAVKGSDLVINTAGPFQQLRECETLQACIAHGVPYMDVCDDLEYSQIARSFCSQAQDACVPAITSAGIYPGVSNLMAAQMVEADDADAESVSYFYFTAGSGGVGQTILATSYHLCAEPVTVYRSHEKQTWEPATHRAVVDFGQGLRKRETFAYNLPEVSSTHEILGVPNVDARFGTDPGIWNLAMVILARTFGSRLKDRALSRRIAALSEPWVRAVDKVVGERAAMRVDVHFKSGRKAVGLYDHVSLSEGVGTCTAAFATCMLEGLTEPGVWYPEHLQAVADRELLLERAAVGSERFLLNKAPFQVESEPKKLGMGLYIE